VTVRRQRGAPRLLVVAALLAITTGVSHPAAGALEFREVGEGIAYAPLALPELVGHAFDVDLARTQVRLVSAGAPGLRAPVARLAAGHPAHVAMNASFFDADGRPLGRAVSNGTNVGAALNRYWGALVIDGGTSRVVRGDVAPAGGAVLVQGVPRLVVDASVPALKPQVARRTAVCAAGPRLFLVVVTTEVEAATFAHFLARPRAEGGLGCTNALNLDGGSSTQLSVELPGLTLAVEGDWGVPNALVILPGKGTAPVASEAAR
jgi:uncharacterized protein YigE (DUF2233 family)